MQQSFAGWVSVTRAFKTLNLFFIIFERCRTDTPRTEAEPHICARERSEMGGNISAPDGGNISAPDRGNVNLRQYGMQPGF